MSLLFDTSPTDEPTQKRRSRRPEVTEAVVEQEPSIQAPCIPLAVIDRVDGEAVCLDEACAAACHDIIDSDRGWWRLECCLCGTGQWIPAIDGRLEERKPRPQHGAFTFPDGRHHGKTIAEVAASRPDYVSWAAKHDQDEETRKACETWIASNGGSL